MTLPGHIRAKILQRRRARFEREREQRDLLPDREIHKQSIAAKLIGYGSGTQMDNFQRCGVEELWATCEQCGHAEKFFYNCNRKWCPRCNVRLAAMRAEKLRLWASTIQQPKHLVLTMRNFEVLTRSKIRQFQKALLRLRKQKVWAAVKGGCASIEITNESAGWHLHAHVLVDARWVCAGTLARNWGELLQQEFGIVKVKDCRGLDYVLEVAKYVAKSSELAKWDGNRLWEFITAVKGCRFFFAFGSLFKMGKEIRRALAEREHARRVCACGCDRVRVQTEASMVMEEIHAHMGIHRRRKY